MRAIVVLPPAKTSHELDLFRSMPEWDLTVVTGNGFGPDDAHHSLPTRRIPYLGSPQRWTAALAWHRGLADVEFPPADVVVSVELHSPVSTQAAKVARALGVPHVVTIWETLPDNPLYSLPPWRGTLRSLVESADGFVCFTERARTHARALGCDPSRCHVVHPGVDVERYRPAADGLAAPSVLLFVGELRADKGILDVIAACDDVHARHDDLRLVVVGDGSLRKRVETLAATRRFLDARGLVPRDAIPQMLRDSRALVVAPHRRRFWEEQFGFAYVEAMASGIPVVTTRCGAIPEIVPPVNGLVAEGDVTALASAIETMLGPRATEVGRVNRQTVLERFDLRRQGAQMADVLRRVVRQSRRRSAEQ